MGQNDLSGLGAYPPQLSPLNVNTHELLPPPDQPSSQYGHAHGAIHKVYARGIQFIDAMEEVEGIMAMVMGTGALVFFWFFVKALSEFGPGEWPVWFVLGMTLLGLAFARIDFVGYRYSPTLFDRAAQKVHVFVDHGTRLWEVWRWFGNTHHEVLSFDWACVRAEVAEVVVLGSGNVPRHEHLLMLAFTDVPRSANVVARVGVGYTDAYVGPHAAAQRFEHIRRYMQEGGPALAAGDHLYEDKSRMSLWGALTYGQPLIGPDSGGWWTGKHLHAAGPWFITVPFGLFCLVLLPLSVPAGLLRGLAHWSKREPTWPAPIADSVGRPVPAVEAMAMRPPMPPESAVLSTPKSPPPPPTPPTRKRRRRR